MNPIYSKILNLYKGVFKINIWDPITSVGNTVSSKNLIDISDRKKNHDFRSNKKNHSKHFIPRRIRIPSITHEWTQISGIYTIFRSYKKDLYSLIHIATTVYIQSFSFMLKNPTRSIYMKIMYFSNIADAIRGISVLIKSIRRLFCEYCIDQAEIWELTGN